MTATKWTKGDWVPLGGLQAWHAADAASSGQIIPDLSGNGRTLDAGSSNPPSLQTNILNGYPAVYFNGSTHEPLKYVGSLNVKHVFIVGSYELAAFATFAGLIGGISTVDILVGFNGLTQWFDFSSTYGSYDYRLADVHYSESAALAPMSGGHSVMEYSNPAGLVMSGLQIGQQKTFTDRRWRGWYFESLIYNRILSDFERWRVYRYLACKYKLWQRTAGGKNVFPFPADTAYDMDYARETYISEPYDGEPTALMRGNFRHTVMTNFSLRRPEELDAAKTFYEEHWPLGQFIFRDYRYYPPQDKNVRFNSTFGIRGSDVSFRFNYSFDLLEM